GLGRAASGVWKPGSGRAFSPDPVQGTADQSAKSSSGPTTNRAAAQQSGMQIMVLLPA
ncbi:hypothetical protein IWW55_003884, partial [Coemansia sp. RSA 2706]